LRSTSGASEHDPRHAAPARLPRTGAITRGSMAVERAMVLILCMRADFYGALMVQRCWRELEPCQYAVAPLDEAGLRVANNSNVLAGERSANAHPIELPGAPTSVLNAHVGAKTCNMRENTSHTCVGAARAHVGARLCHLRG